MVYAIIQDDYGKEFQYNCKDHDAIYERIINLTGDEQEAIEIASWCEIATVGERFLGNGITVDICE